MTDRTIVITGASSGIGASAAFALSAAGWHVAVVGRNAERTRAVAAATSGTPFIADFDSLDEVRSLASALLERYERIDVLANNAGGLVSKREYSTDGFERTLQRNHLAPFLLTDLLLPRLLESNGRVIATASVANTWGQLRLDDLDWRNRPWFGGWRAYGTSKIMAIMFTRELARRTSLTAYSFHPGYVSTGFGADAPIVKLAALVSKSGLGLTPQQGAAPLVHLATGSIESPSGTHFDGFRPDGRLNRAVRDEALAAGLWDASAQLVGAGTLAAL